MTTKSLPGVLLSGSNLQDMHTFIHRYCGKDRPARTVDCPQALLACGLRARGRMLCGVAADDGSDHRLECGTHSYLFMNKAHMTAAPPQNSPASAVIEFSSADHRGGSAHQQVRRASGHSLSSRTQRISAYRPRQVDLPQFRPGGGKRRRLPSALRRHQSGQGRRRVRGFDQGCGALARFRLGRRTSTTRPTTSIACTSSLVI